MQTGATWRRKARFLRGFLRFRRSSRALIVVLSVQSGAGSDAPDARRTEPFSALQPRLERKETGGAAALCAAGPTVRQRSMDQADGSPPRLGEHAPAARPTAEERALTPGMWSSYVVLGNKSQDCLFDPPEFTGLLCCADGPTLVREWRSDKLETCRSLPSPSSQPATL
jgi:hypothetical protein